MLPLYNEQCTRSGVVNSREGSKRKEKLVKIDFRYRSKANFRRALLRWSKQRNSHCQAGDDSYLHLVKLLREPASKRFNT